MITQKYDIGTQFTRTTGRKNKHLETIIDVYRTYNNDSELVKIRYVASHEFTGQTITDYDVLETAIARSTIEKRKVLSIDELDMLMAVNKQYIAGLGIYDDTKQERDKLNLVIADCYRQIVAMQDIEVAQ